MPRKRVHPVRQTGAQRSVASRNRKLAEGWRTKSFVFPPDVAAQLAALALAEGIGEGRVIERLIRQAADVASLEGM